MPVVVSNADGDAARPLRGLLKSPRGADEPEDSELERKRKMVSFHGDVTVYLFDQVGRPGGRGSLQQGMAWSGSEPWGAGPGAERTGRVGVVLERLTRAVGRGL